jgi:hypothetical protein
VPLRLTTRDLFAALPAVSGLTLGALYALGVFLTVSQLVGADVPASQALPLIPLQDHLAKGLAAVFTSPLVLTWATGGFIALLWGYAASRSSAQREREFRVSFDAASALSDKLQADAAREHDQLQTDLDNLRKYVEDAGNVSDNDPRAALFASRLQDLTARSEAFTEPERLSDRLAEVEKQIALAEAHASAIDRSVERMRAVARLSDRVARFLALVLFISALFVPLDLILLPVFGGLLILFWWRIMPLYPALGAVLVVSAILVPLLVAGYVNPTPLPVTSITTDRGITRGGLVTASGDRYVITRHRDSLESIPASEVRSAEVRKRKRERKPSIFQLIT